MFLDLCIMERFWRQEIVFDYPSQISTQATLFILWSMQALAPHYYILGNIHHIAVFFKLNMEVTYFPHDFAKSNPKAYNFFLCSANENVCSLLMGKPLKR